MPATFVKSLTDLKDLPVVSRPQVALVGRSNVGKSSLINRLIGQKALARVSATPGHTKTINFYEVDRRYFLVDLPGYGYTKMPKDLRDEFGTMMHDYVEHAQDLVLVLLMIDARRGMAEADHQMQAILATAKIPTVMVLNKIDKLNRLQADELVRTITAMYPGLKVIAHSSSSNIGRGEILEEIRRATRE